MQLFKNMEVVLMLVFGIVCAAVAFTPASTTRPAARARVDAADRAATIPAMPTVHVIGHRLAQEPMTPAPATALQD